MEYEETIAFPNFGEYLAIEDMNAPKQYREFKKKYPDAIILFRTGDFYETYCEDAETCSNILGTIVTSRKYRLTGFPHYALDTYLPKLIRAGKRVAICEKQEPIKTIKKRITEVVNN